MPVRAGEGRRHRRGGSGRPTRRARDGGRASIPPSARRGRSNQCEQVPPRVFGRLPRRGGCGELRRARPRKRRSGMGVGDVAVCRSGCLRGGSRCRFCGVDCVGDSPEGQEREEPSPIRQGEPLRLTAPSSPTHRNTSRRCQSRGRPVRRPLPRPSRCLPGLKKLPNSSMPPHSSMAMTSAFSSSAN